MSPVQTKRIDIRFHDSRSSMLKELSNSPIVTDEDLLDIMYL